MVAVAFLLLAAQDFAGSASCAACHSAIAGKQGTTHHANALSRTPDNRWAFGSGAQAITWLSQAGEDTYVEHGLSWYRRTRTLGLTPGHTTKKGVVYRTLAPDAAVLRCFRCHSTGKLNLSESRSIEPAEPGVRCEACHGPGSQHARSPERENIRNPASLKATEINDLCGQCHRTPTPEDVATNFNNVWNVRHQPVYFSQSKCFLKSEEKFSCLSCHNPHEDAKPLANEKCARCHEKPKHKEQISHTSCIACHMPAVNASPMLTFVNHWIGIYQLSGPRANPLRPLEQRPGR